MYANACALPCSCAVCLLSSSKSAAYLPGLRRTFWTWRRHLHRSCCCQSKEAETDRHRPFYITTPIFYVNAGKPVDLELDFEQDYLKNFTVNWNEMQCGDFFFFFFTETPKNAY